MSSSSVRQIFLPSLVTAVFLVSTRQPVGAQQYRGVNYDRQSLLVVPQVDEVQIEKDYHPRPPQVPEYVVFAGDTFRFDRPDLRERMDRELIAFTYMHATTTLMLKRSRRYFARVEPILRRNGIPVDLKYLMVIESNLDPKSRSTVGAAGLWQFMKATGQHYGLEVGNEVDERYNIEKATAAACTYLGESYSMFGDWMTAAASYNHGQDNVRKRLEAQHQKRAFDLWMPEETTRYMFRILAAKMLFDDPAAFGFDIRDEEYYPVDEFSHHVVVRGEIPSLVDFALQYGVTYAALKAANLWLRDDKLTNSRKKEYEILIPM